VRSGAGARSRRVVAADDVAFADPGFGRNRNVSVSNRIESKKIWDR
jgi:hypothetical protein